MHSAEKPASRFKRIQVLDLFSRAGLAMRRSANAKARFDNAKMAINPAPGKNMRRCSGVSVVVLTFSLAVFVVGLLGVFSYEFTRVSTARQELQHVCEAAALAAAARMPSPYQYMNPNSMPWTGSGSDLAGIHDLCETAGQQVFVSNQVLQSFLTESTF